MPAKSGTSATRAKNKYNDKSYDQVRLLIKPKGKKDTIKAHAESKGESLNGFVNRAIDETMQRDNAPWRTATNADASEGG